jgi:polar amino acid transport system substrate-binding protein
MLGLVSGQAMADQFQDVLDAGKIRIGVIADVAPFGFVDAEQKPAGLDVDIANMIAADLGVDLEIVPVTAQNRIPYLVADKVDILVAFLSLTPERAKQVMFTAPYASSSIGIFGEPGVAVAGVADLEGKSIGVMHGTVEDTALTNYAPDANIIRFEDNAAATAAYLNGQVDLQATVDVLAYELNKGNGRKLEIKVPFGDDFAHVGVKAGEFGMLQWLNSFIYVHKANGDLNDLSLKWLARPVADLPPL